MKAIELNGEKLHNVRMYLEPRCPGIVMALSYPKSRIHYEFEDENLLIDVPAFLAVELFRKGVLPQQQDTPIAVKESGRPKGSFLIQKVIYPETPGKDIVRLKFRKNI